MQFESEFSAEENESHDEEQVSDDDFVEVGEKTPPRVNQRLIEVEEVRNIRLQSITRYKFKGAGEDQPGEDQPTAKAKKTKWKRKTAQQEQKNEAKKRNKPNFKYPTKKKFYRKAEKDKDEEIQVAKHLNRSKESVKIRNSPRLLSEVLSCLSKEQKSWVKKTGFGDLLQFDLEMLPGPFSYNVLQIFEHNSVSLRLSNGHINIVEEDVVDVLGLPKGGDSIMLGSHDEYKERLAKWQSQFPMTKKDQEQITTSKVVEKMKGPELTENFKLNFLIVMSNVLVGTSSNAYVDKQILRFDHDLDKCYDCNWAEYLLNALVSGMASWNCSTSLFFNGSLIFLTLLYVDRVRHKGLKLVERNTPSYKGWTEAKLKERQAIELFDGKFGVGSILPPLRDLPINKSKRKVSDEQSKVWNEYEGHEGYAQDWNNYEQDHMQSPTKNAADWNDYQHDRELDQEQPLMQSRMENAAIGDESWDAWISVSNQNSSSYVWGKAGNHDQIEEQTENVEDMLDEVEVLRLRAQDLINAKAQFDEDMKKAKEKYTDDVYILSIEHVMNEVFHPCRENDIQLDKNKDCDKQEPILSRNQSTAENENVCDVGAEFKLRHDDIACLEIIEYLNSTQAMIDMPDIFGTEAQMTVEIEKRDDIPSFSLGIEEHVTSEVCQDIQTADEDNENNDDNDFVTPGVAVREKSTRVVKLGRYAKSPYIERVIDIRSKYTKEDISTWIYMIQKKDLLFDIFIWDGLTCIREHMQTLQMKTRLYYSVIDVWTIILNDNENYKADESPFRLFCPVGSLHSTLNLNMNITASYAYFSENMVSILKRYDRKLTDLDMVFFPINKYEHFYVICYNLKKEAWEIIDNVKRTYSIETCYGQITTILHSHFTRFMEENGLLKLAKRMQKLKPSCLQMPWQTISNSTDCGIFAMRHMETYKGDSRSWNTGFDKEGKTQDNQIFRLRMKYNSAILLSSLNENKDAILKEANELFNQATEKKFMKFLDKASTARSSKKQGKIKTNFANKKTVTFATNLATSFDEAKS